MDPRQLLEARKAKILDDAKKAAAEIDRDLSLIEQAKAVASKYGFDFVEADVVARPLSPAPHKSRRDPNSPSQLSQRFCEEVIRDYNHPVSIHELKRFMADRGVIVGGKNPIATLSAYLSSNASLASMRKGWWGLKEWIGTPKANVVKLIYFGDELRPKEQAPTHSVGADESV
ncbi:hypothetical protein V3H18_10745 [Methylocystis sp. 9N]|uniref:DUF2786 domain-containing protein n=1 Tax=Methylocystis borbori TaxID=3118750 RepID=A0ABU7XHZ7_9HYPH